MEPVGKSVFIRHFDVDAGSTALCKNEHGSRFNKHAQPMPTQPGLDTMIYRRFPDKVFIIIIFFFFFQIKAQHTKKLVLSEKMIGQQIVTNDQTNQQLICIRAGTKQSDYTERLSKTKPRDPPTCRQCGRR